MIAAPSKFAFQPHIAPVSSISCSPHHRHFFLTSSGDGSARLYSLLHAEPLLTFEPSGESINCIDWSLTKSTVFFLGDSSGSIYFYDLNVS